MPRSAIRTIGLILLLIALFAATADAWDGRRKGFVFGGSVGPATIPTFLKYSYSSYRIIQVGAELTLGYAPIDQLHIQYAGRALWFPVWTVISSPSLAATLYHKPEAPSFFLTAGGGLAAVSYGPYFLVGEPGANVFGGVGYEWARGWRVSLEYTHYWWEDFDESIDDVRIGVGILGY